MANVRLKAPENASSCSFEGEDVPIQDGHVVVSERVARALHPHGYTLAAETPPEPPAARTVERDEELVEEGETAIDPDTMNKAELMAFLRGENVIIEKGSSVGALRALVRSHLENAKE